MAGNEFRAVLFVDCDFSEMTTAGATFDECTFRNVRFNASVHTGTAFTNRVRCASGRGGWTGRSSTFLVG